MCKQTEKDAKQKQEEQKFQDISKIFNFVL